MIQISPPGVLNGACLGDVDLTEPPDRLPSRWRSRALFLRAHHAEGQAVAYENAARELDEACAHWLNESLSIQQAAAESGLGVDHLRRLVREGKVPNAGRKGAPRIRRRDLPARRGLPSTTHDQQNMDTKEQIARAVVASNY